MNSPLFHSLLFAALVSVGIAQEPKKPAAPVFSSDLSGGDMKFLVTAAEQGTLQSTLSQIAAGHAQSADVKEFALTLAKEHAVQNEKIKLIAIQKKFALPEALNAEKNPIADKLEKLQGLKFDKAYMEEMLKQEQNYVAIFEQAIQSKDPEIRSFASSVLPVIKEHLAFLTHTSGSAPRGAVTPQFRVNVIDSAPTANEKS